MWLSKEVAQTAAVLRQKDAQGPPPGTTVDAPGRKVDAPFRGWTRALPAQAQLRAVCAGGEDRALETLGRSLPPSQRPEPSLDTQEVAGAQLDAAARLLPGTVTVTSAGTDWTISNESPQSFARMPATEDVKGGNSHSQPK